jgi:hypothetical protein
MESYKNIIKHYQQSKLSQICKPFIMGSCRLWKSAEINNWVHKNRDNVLHSHYCDEIIQHIKWLCHKENLTREELLCFRTEEKQEQWLGMKQEFKNANLILIEISSIKMNQCQLSKLYKNLLIVDENTKPRVTFITTNTELTMKLNEIIRLLTIQGKNVIFICHNNTFSDQTNAYNSFRQTIQQSFHDCKKQTNVQFFDPTSVISNYGKIKCLTKLSDSSFYDHNHYTQFMIEKQAKSFKTILRKYFKQLK